MRQQAAQRRLSPPRSRPFQQQAAPRPRASVPPRLHTPETNAAGRMRRRRGKPPRRLINRVRNQQDVQYVRRRRRRSHRRQCFPSVRYCAAASARSLTSTTPSPFTSRARRGRMPEAERAVARSAQQRLPSVRKGCRIDGSRMPLQDALAPAVCPPPRARWRRCGARWRASVRPAKRRPNGQAPRRRLRRSEDAARPRRSRSESFHRCCRSQSSARPAKRRRSALRVHASFEN